MKTKWKIHFFNAVSSAVEGRNAQFGMNEKKLTGCELFYGVFFYLCVFCHQFIDDSTNHRANDWGYPKQPNL